MIQYTPRQGTALLSHVRTRKRGEIADLIWAIAMAQTDGKEIDRTIRELVNEPD